MRKHAGASEPQTRRTSLMAYPDIDTSFRQIKHDAQHTPGPWRVHKMTRIEASDYGLIANVRGNLSDRVTHANAHLIAAAPETAAERDRLKQTLEEIVHLIEGADYHPDPSPSHDADLLK